MEWPATTWSVLVSDSCDETERRDRFGRLIERYWPVVFHFLRTWRCRDNEDAKDLTQGFFLFLLERPAVDNFRRGGAKFRTYLRRVLDHYLLKEHRDAHRQKRAARLQSLDAMADFDPPAPRLRQGDTEDTTFDRAWIETVFTHAFTQTARRLREAGRHRRLVVFERIDRAKAEGREAPTMQALADELGIHINEVKVDLRLARELFTSVVRDQIADTVATPDDLADELRAVWGK